MDCELYFLKGLMLRLYPKSYLVEVGTTGDIGVLENSLEDLPGWVLGSRRTIWLTLENAPMYRRAQQGDAIKDALQHAKDASP